MFNIKWAFLLEYEGLHGSIPTKLKIFKYSFNHQPFVNPSFEKNNHGYFSEVLPQLNVGQDETQAKSSLVILRIRLCGAEHTSPT